MKKISVLILSLYSFLTAYGQFSHLPLNGSSYNVGNIHFSFEPSTNSYFYELSIDTDSTFSNPTFYTIYNNDTLISLTDGNYYYKVRLNENGFFHPWSQSKAFLVFSLNNISNLFLWLDSDSSSFNSNYLIDTLYDKSGLSKHLIQTTESKKPLHLHNSINNHSATYFDNSNMYVDFNNITPQPFTMFLVNSFESNQNQMVFDGYGAERIRFQSYNSLLRIKTATTQETRYNLTTPTNYFISTLIYDQNNSKMYNDGVLKSSGTIGSNGIDGLWLGSTKPPHIAFFNGSLAELIILDTVMLDSTRILLENYLKTKYTPYPNLGDDLFVCDTKTKIGFRADHAYSNIVWSTGQTGLDSIVITQNGTYWVEVVSFGWTISDTIEITGILEAPQISYNQDTVLCLGDSLTVSYLPIPDYVPVWSSGDTANSYTIKDYSQNVFLAHYDTNNCFASTDTFFVKIDSVQLQSTLGDNRNLCNGSVLEVSTTSNEGPFEYTWSTGDTTPSLNFNIYGLYNISVEMVDFNGCVFRDTVQINALNLPAPNVNFIADTACPNLPTSFTDLSTPAGTDNIIDWKWRFLNNDTATIPNPAYSFPEGIFDVELIVETDSGCTNSLIKAIRTHKQPVARITSPILCAQGEGPISSSSLAPVPDVIAAHHWLIDGNTYTGNSPLIYIDSAGFYDIQLIVESDKGCLDTTIQTIEVFPALLPDFEAANICIGDTTQFIETTPSFSVVARNWNFGFFNQGSTAQNPSFYYPSIGSYTVSLSVENAIGCTNEISKTIDIRELPTVNFGSSILCGERLSSFYDLSTSPMGSIVRQAWTINDTTRIGDTVNYVFSDLGPKDIRLEVEDNFGCVNAITSTLEVFDVPEVDFSFTPNYGEAPIDINFSNLSSANAVDFFWDFGDGVGTSIEAEPVYSYSTNGTYTILLRGSTAEGCADSSFKEIPIIPTELDIALSNFSIQKTNLADGSIAYQPSVLLQNVGTRAIFNAELLFSVNNETSIAETWEGILPVGQSVFYTLDNFALIKNLELLDYLCLEAGYVNDNTEINLNNNKTCLIQKGSIQTSLPYPNPGQNEVNIDVIMENDDELSIEIYDLNGRLVLSSKNLALLEGYNKLSIETSTLQAGKYIVFLNYNDEIISHSLIIENP